MSVPYEDLKTAFAVKMSFEDPEPDPWVPEPEPDVPRDNDGGKVPVEPRA